jgi:hypothetical protein
MWSDRRVTEGFRHPTGPIQQRANEEDVRRQICNRWDRVMKEIPVERRNERVCPG